MTASPIDLRVLLADAYRDAALTGAAMPLATRALEAVRDRGVGDEPAYLALEEVGRQLGQATDNRLVSALIALAEAIAEAKTRSDLEAVREAVERDPALGWAELRRRFVRALAAFQDTVALGLARRAVSVVPDHGDVVGRWIEQLRFMAREEWAPVRELFESLGRDRVIRASDRARLLARAAQVFLYIEQDVAAADRTLDEARATLEDESAAPDGARCEVMCVAGQVELERGDRAKGKALLQRAREIDPSFEDAYRYMGDAFAEDPTGGPEAQAEAERWYVLGMENAPGGTLNLVALAGMLGKPEHYQSRRLRVAELRQHALRVTWKNRYSIYTLFASIALDNGELDEAQDLAQRALEEDRTRLEAQILAARIQAARGELLEAIQSFGRAWSSSPEEFSSWATVEELAKQAPDAAAAQALLEALDSAFGSAARAHLVSTRIQLLEKLERWEDAEAASQEALADEENDAAHRSRISRIRNNRANRLFEQESYAESVVWYERALEAAPEDAVLWGNLAGALDRDTNPDGRLERLGRVVDAYHRAIVFGGDTPDPEYVERYATLPVRYAVARRYGLRALDRQVTALALGIDVSPKLLPLVIVPETTTLSAECLATVERVRERIARERGVLMPGVLFRELDAGVDEKTYVLTLSGLPVAHGSVPADRVLLLGAAPPPSAPADRPPANDPVSGELGFWISPTDVALVMEPHRVITPVEYALLDLARHYLRNARTEVTIDDVVRIIEAAELGGAAELMESDGMLHRLTRVIRWLLAEGAPVSALQAIADVVREAPSDATVTALVEQVRMVPGVRERLVGNEGGRAVLELDRHWSAVVRNSVWREDAEPSLAIVPDECQALLAAVREMVEHTAGPAVLLTDGDVRPFVRWVLEIEFPDLAVVSREEFMHASRPRRAELAYAPLMESVR